MKFKHLKNVHIQHPVAVMFSSCEAVPINQKSSQIKIFIATGVQKLTELRIAIDEKQAEPGEKLQVLHERRSLVHADIAFDDKGRMHHVGNYRIAGKTIAVICTNQGVFVEFEGVLHALLTQLHPETFDAHTLYGPSALFQDRILCIGTSNGSVLFYRHQHHQPASGQSPTISIVSRQVSTDGLNFDFCGNVELLSSGITAIAADSKSLAVADKAGRIFILNTRSTYAASSAAADVPQFQPFEFSCNGTTNISGDATAAAAGTRTTAEVTCLRFSQQPYDFLIVGTMSGKIQYFERSTGQLRYEIDAHAKAISDLSVRQNTLLTTSQDGFVRVWIIDDNTDRLIHTQSLKIDDSYPTGVTFLNDRMFCVVSYDDPIVQFFESHVG